MAISVLPRWNLQPNRPSFYDTDSATLLELASKMQAAFNEMVTEYNKVVETVNSSFEEFINNTNADQEAFQVGIRQEFQDFIDTINMIATQQNNTIDEVVNYMQTNLVTTVQNEINSVLDAGKIRFDWAYNAYDESLDIVVSGGE